MEKGKLNFCSLNETFHAICTLGNFILYEHDQMGEECIICWNDVKEIYCYTEESLQYTVNNQEEFEWYFAR